jgi:hypothetical protein
VLLPVITIKALVAVSVRFVTVVAVHDVQVTVDVASVSVLVVVPEIFISPHVTETSFVFNVPAVSVNCLEPILKASCNAHTPPVPLNATSQAKAFPAEVTVVPADVDRKLSESVAINVNVMFAIKVKLP